MTIDAPLALFRDKVRPEWIDYNGHMNVAYYVLAFDWATDAFLEFASVNKDYRNVRGCSTFALHNNVTYLRELHEGEPIRITTQLIGLDEKRVHYFHTMYRGASDGESDEVAATVECLSIHVDLTARRVQPFPEDIQASLGNIRDAHAAMPAPPGLGKVIQVGTAPAKDA